MPEQNAFKDANACKIVMPRLRGHPTAQCNQTSKRKNRIPCQVDISQAGVMTQDHRQGSAVTTSLPSPPNSLQNLLYSIFPRPHHKASRAFSPTSRFAPECQFCESYPAKLVLVQQPHFCLLSLQTAKQQKRNLAERSVAVV